MFYRLGMISRASPPRTERQQRHDDSECDPVELWASRPRASFEIDAIRELVAMNAKPEQCYADVDKIAQNASDWDAQAAVGVEPS